MNPSKYNFITSGDIDFSQMNSSSQAIINFDISENNFSTYYQHAVIFDRIKNAYWVGQNTGKQITSDSINQSEDWIKVNFSKSNKKFDILKAVCGSCYTLYLTRQDDIKRVVKLRWQNANYGKEFSIDADAKDIFGGDKTAAITTHDLKLIIISELMTMSNYYYHKPFIVNLTSHPKEVACLDESILVLSVDNTLTEFDLTEIEKGVPKKKKIKFGRTIDHISGTFQHCFILTESGEVFARGSNEFGKLGFAKRFKEQTQFVKVTALSHSKIVKVSAGYNHSLFIDENGAVYACGENIDGNLFLDESVTQEDVYLPVLTTIESGATFCLAGRDMSVVITDGSAAKKASKSKKSNNKEKIISDKDLKSSKKRKIIEDDGDDDDNDDEDDKQLRNKKAANDKKSSIKKKIIDDDDNDNDDEERQSRNKKATNEKSSEKKIERNAKEEQLLDDIRSEVEQIRQMIYSQNEQLGQLVNGYSNTYQLFDNLVENFEFFANKENDE